MATPAPVVKVYYGKVLFPDVSRVLACLYEKDVKFDLIDMYAGQRMNPDLIRLQASRAPVSGFEDGDTRLFESRAICRYIVDKYADRGNKYLLGRDLLERASIEQWLKTEEHSFDPHSSALVFHLAFNIEPDRALVTESEWKLSKVLDVYEQRLRESKFLAGDEFSLADLSHLPNSHYLARSKEWGHLFESRKNVSKWWEEISSRHSWQEVVKLLNMFGLLRDAEVTSEGRYQFLTNKKLDLQSAALEAISDALSSQKQGQTTEPTSQNDMISQQVATSAQLSAEQTATALPSSQTEVQPVQLASEEDFNGQSKAQQTNDQSSTQLPTVVPMSSQKQGMKEQRAHQADSTGQLIDEQKTTPAATMGAPLSQTQNAQQARQVDFTKKSSARKITSGAQFSTRPSDGPIREEQKKDTQKMHQADAPGQSAAAEGTAKEEKISQQRDQSDSTSQVVDPKARRDAQSTTMIEQGITDVLTRQKEEKEKEATHLAAGNKLIAQEAPADAQSTAEPPPTGAPSIQKKEENSQQKSDANSSLKMAGKQGPVDAQSFTQQGPLDALSRKKQDQQEEPIDQPNSGLPISPRPPTDSKSSMQPPTAGAQPGQKQEPNVQKTFNQTTAKQVPRDVKSSTEQGPASQLTAQEDTKGQSIPQQVALDAQPSPKLPTRNEKSSQEEEQDIKQTSQEKSAAQAVADQGPVEGKLPTQQDTPSAILSEKKEENAQEKKEENAQETAATRQRDSPGQSVDHKDTAEGKSSNPPTSTESTSQTDATGGTNRQ